MGKSQWHNNPLKCSFLHFALHIPLLPQSPLPKRSSITNQEAMLWAAWPKPREQLYIIFKSNFKFLKKVMSIIQRDLFLNHLKISRWHDTPSDCTEFTYISYKQEYSAAQPQCNHQNKKLTLMYYHQLILRPHWSFTNCSKNVLYKIHFRTVHYI